MIALDVVTEAGDWPADEIEAVATRAAEAASAVAGLDPEPVSATLLLTDDAAIRVLNGRWRGKDAPTNVLSFPSDMPAPPGEPDHLGDVALAYETVRREAAEEGKTLADHVAHLVVHGILHLLGEDHGSDLEAEAMERREVEALARIGIADPYRQPA